jgi:hypothetical protein
MVGVCRWVERVTRSSTPAMFQAPIVARSLSDRAPVVLVFVRQGGEWVRNAPQTPLAGVGVV